jgi:hypothetical protein
MTEVRRVRGGSLDNVRTGRDKKGVKLEDTFDLIDLKQHDGKFQRVRLVGNLVGTATHWVLLEKKDGDLVSIPFTCLSYDPEVMDFDPDKKCPYCEARQQFMKKNIEVKYRGRKQNPVSLNVSYFNNAIDRELQEEITPRIATDEERESGPPLPREFR